MPFIPNTQIAASAGGLSALKNVTLGSDQASPWQITGIPVTSTHLLVYLIARSTIVATIEQMTMRFNNDSGSNYDLEYQQTVTAAIGAAEEIGTTTFGVSGVAVAAFLPGASSPAAAAATLIMQIPFYSQTTWRKTIQTFNSASLTDASGGQAMLLSAGEWRSTAAVNEIDFFLGSGSFASGSQVIVYGI